MATESAENLSLALYIDLVEAQVIRLIELLPGAPDDPVVVRLSIQQLEHTQEYDAISYVWGDSQNRVPIECNGSTINITLNLEAAFRRIRYQDRSRIVWADAICINQGNIRERSHHVSFMNRIYKLAKKVLLCMGNDPDGGAENIVSLIDEHVSRMSGYASITDMPVLAADDPVFEDARWKSLAALMGCVWFSRAWVLQEAGMAADPRVLYGSLEFSYRDLMNLSRWIMRCAPQLQPISGINLLTIHTDWEEWLIDWQEKTTFKYTLLDFLSHAKGLQCKSAHDHVYAFLGHPVAQLGDGSGPIIRPDYSKPVVEVYQQITKWMLPRLGLRVLSAVEHDELTINEDVSSWIVRWDMDIIQNSMGYYSEFYYRASALENPVHPVTIEGDLLKVQGVYVDVALRTYQFSATMGDWGTNDALEALQSAGALHDILDQIWSDIHRNETPCKYSSDRRLDAFSLALTAGLANYLCAEEDLERHRANFTAFWALHQALSRGVVPAELQQASGQGDAYGFWFDLSLSCKGRSFFITQEGYYGLGPWIMKPGDTCHIFSGARVPFVLRRNMESHKVIGEAYIHGIMHGESTKNRDDGIGWEDLTLR
ncbi:MAG: hypothetical protein M1840_000326 [Geoglossum simile]|nr:MAG: hypothetical protein M1840_000326 [Geoglossum simile]